MLKIKVLVLKSQIKEFFLEQAQDISSVTGRLDFSVRFPSYSVSVCLIRNLKQETHDLTLFREFSVFLRKTNLQGLN